MVADEMVIALRPRPRPEEHIKRLPGGRPVLAIDPSQIRPKQGSQRTLPAFRIEGHASVPTQLMNQTVAGAQTRLDGVPVRRRAVRIREMHARHVAPAPAGEVRAPACSIARAAAPALHTARRSPEPAGRPKDRTRPTPASGQDPIPTQSARSRFPGHTRHEESHQQRSARPGTGTARPLTDACQARPSAALRGDHAQVGADGASARPKSASTDSLSADASRSATATDGNSRPVSMALISVRETALCSASCAWDQPRINRCCATADGCEGSYLDLT